MSDRSEMAELCRWRAEQYERLAEDAEAGGDIAKAAQMRGAALAARRQAKRYEDFETPPPYTEV